MPKIVFHPKAKQEFYDAISWYEEQKKGLGLKLLSAVEETLSRIKTNPELFPKVHKNFQMAVVEIFPYSIFFKVEKGDILVLSVFHQKRKPSVWKKRKS